MSSKTSFAGYDLAVVVTAAGLLAVSSIVVATPGRAQSAPAASTTSIESNSEKARAMKQPSYETREERLRAKPLDWTKTIGKPAPVRKMTDAERKAMENLKGETAGGGAPNPKAEEEA